MIRVGIGGWSFPPWRGPFYPEGLPQAQELHFASRALTSIEINSTFYRTQKPATFAGWATQTPEDFVFAVKAPSYATNRRVLAEAAPSVERFVSSGIAELGGKLGPILWQFPPTKKFDPDDFAAFLALLPAKAAGVKLKHALEVRHESFCTAAFVALAKRHGAAIVLADSEKYPAIADITGDFVYARLQQAKEALAHGYAPKELDAWAKRAVTWAAGGAPKDLPLLSSAPSAKRRDVFLYMINGAKVRAPAAAQTLLTRLGADAKK